MSTQTDNIRQLGIAPRPTALLRPLVLQHRGNATAYGDTHSLYIDLRQIDRQADAEQDLMDRALRARDWDAAGEIAQLHGFIASNATAALLLAGIVLFAVKVLVW